MLVWAFTPMIYCTISWDQNGWVNIQCNQSREKVVKIYTKRQSLLENREHRSRHMLSWLLVVWPAYAHKLQHTHLKLLGEGCKLAVQWMVAIFLALERQHCWYTKRVDSVASLLDWVSDIWRWCPWLHVPFLFMSVWKNSWEFNQNKVE